MKVNEFIEKCIMLPIVKTRGIVYYLTPLSKAALKQLSSRIDETSHCFNEYVDLSKKSFPDINRIIGDYDIELISAINLPNLPEPIIELIAN